MEKFGKNIEGIRKMLKELKSEKYALVNSELVVLDEYVKGLYLKVLCTVVQYENDPTDMQVLFLNRIVKGISADDTVQEYMRKALEISEADIQEFLSIIGNSNVKYYFTTDGLILSSMGKGNADGYEYLAEIIELLEINKDDLEYICMVVKSILQQESSYYDQSKELVNERVEKLDFAPYIQNYYAGAIVDTDTEKHYSAPDKKLSEAIEYPHVFKERKVVFENVILNIDKEWTFQGCEEVIIRNCELISKGGRINVHSVGTLYYEGCKVTGFKDRVAYIQSVNNLSVENSEFIECGYTCDGDKRGGVFAIKNNYDSPLKMIKLIGNKLLNCYIQAKSKRYNFGVSGVFVGFEDSNHIELKVIVVDNNFVGCRCINNGNYTMAIIGNFTFYDKIEERNNICSGELTRLFEDNKYENNR